MKSLDINYQIDVTTNIEENSEKASKESKSTPNLTVKPQTIDTLNNLKQSTLDLFKTSKRLIQIYSFSLDRRILSNREIELTITKLIRFNRNSKIQCLICDEKELQGYDHRLVSLAQKFTSFIEIRVIPDDFKNTISSYYLIDKQFMIYRNNRESYEALLFSQRQVEVKNKIQQFEDVWQQSRPASFLRALFL